MEFAQIHYTLHNVQIPLAIFSNSDSIWHSATSSEQTLRQSSPPSLPISDSLLRPDHQLVGLRVCALQIFYDLSLLRSAMSVLLTPSLVDCQPAKVSFFSSFRIPNRHRYDSPPTEILSQYLVGIRDRFLLALSCLSRCFGGLDREVVPDGLKRTV